MMTFIKFDRFLMTFIDFCRVCKCINDFHILLFYKTVIDCDIILLIDFYRICKCMDDFYILYVKRLL